jgi:hypothetical protein
LGFRSFALTLRNALAFGADALSFAADLENGFLSVEGAEGAEDTLLAAVTTLRRRSSNNQRNETVVMDKLSVCWGSKATMDTFQATTIIELKWHCNLVLITLKYE